MAATETIKDSHFKILGYIEDHGDQLIGKDRHFAIVGYYDKKQDRTKDPHFRIISEGNVLSGLVYQAGLKLG